MLNITILRKRIRWSARCQIQRICSFDTGEKKLNAARPAESMTQPPAAHVLLNRGGEPMCHCKTPKLCSRLDKLSPDEQRMVLLTHFHEIGSFSRQIRPSGNRASSSTLYFRRWMLAAKRPRVFLMETSRLLGSRNLRKTARSFRDL